jgi:hypothetical protein
MGKNIQRRCFMKQSLALGGGAALLSKAGGLDAGPAGKTTAANETLDTLLRLRTIHGNFTDRDIPEEEVEQVLKACVRAANASNMQT